MKRILSIVLALTMALTLLGSVASAERHLTYGIWWDVYYNSGDESWEANPGAEGNR